MPAMMRSNVVLPEPLGPSRPTSSPVSMLRSTCFSTCVGPKRLADIADLDAHALSVPGLTGWNSWTAAPVRAVRTSTIVLITKVTIASSASSEATVKAA